MNPQSFSTLQEEHYDILLRDPLVDTIRFVEYVKLEIAQEDGWLELEIPGHGCMALFHAKYVESYESGDYYWYGESAQEDTVCYLGFAHFLVTDGYLTGTVKLDEKYYEFYAYDEGVSMFVGLDLYNEEYVCEQGAEADTSGIIIHSQTDKNGPVQTRSGPLTSNCIIRVLALYTDAAEAACTDVENIIRETIRQANIAFRRSHVTEMDAELVLVDIQSIDWDETDNIVNDIESLIMDMQDQMTGDIGVRRFNSDADTILVFTNGDYGPLGRAGTLILEEDRALAIIQVKASLRHAAGPHEMVHLFGARHAPCGVGIIPCDNEQTFAHSHQIGLPLWPWKWNTIMHGRAVWQMPFYSNPEGKRWGFQLGIADERDNARQIRNEGCTVANFQDDNNAPAMHIQIGGPGYGCPCYSASLQAHIIGGAAPYQYQWSISSDGFNWSVSGTFSSFSASVPCTIGEGTYVRLIVVSNDNQTAQAFRFFEAANTWPGQGSPCPAMLVATELLASNSFTLHIYPNPASEFAYLSVSTANEISEGQVFVYSIQGLEQFRLPFSTEHTRDLILDTRHLAQGVFLLRFVTQNWQSTAKLIINR